MLRALLVPLFLCFAPLAVHSADPATSAPAESINPRDAKRGWFFYRDPKKEEPREERAPEPAKPPASAAAPKKVEKDPCSDKATWTPNCGFVDPGQDFEFQAKQRDALLERMALSRNDPKVVEHFQRYMRWVTQQAAAVAAMWEYNRVQNPELDPSVTSPVSHLGIQMLREATAKEADGIFKVLRQEGAFFVYFSRSDCDFCHAMRAPLQSLADRTGLDIHNAALDEKCMPGFEARCLAGQAVTGPATVLQVAVVPTVFLHVPPRTWIRIATGVVDAGTMAARTSNFFAQARAATAKSLASQTDPGAGKPAMDFTERPTAGLGKGVEGKSDLPPPTTEEIIQMLRGGAR